MDGKKSKSKAPILSAGLVAIACTTVLTGFAVFTVVKKANQDADLAYAQTVNQYNQLLANKHNSESNDSKSDSNNTTGNVTTSDGETVVTNYTSDDLIQIDGEWYVLSDLLDDDKNDGNGIPIKVNPDKTVLVSGSKYAHIENQEDVDVADSDEIPFFGSEYVVVDIDGTMVYLVEKGDTLSEVSGRVGYSVQELAEHNYIKNVNLIYEGQTIRIPASQEAIEYVKSHQNTNKASNADTSVVDDDSVSDTTTEKDSTEDISVTNESKSN